MVFQEIYKYMIEKKSLDLLKTLIGFDTTSFKSNLNLIKFIENYRSTHELCDDIQVQALNPGIKVKVIDAVIATDNDICRRYRIAIIAGVRPIN